MEFIRALGFTEIKEYKPHYIEKYNGHRVFCHPNYATRITIVKGELKYSDCTADEYRRLNIQVAKILLGEHSDYLAPFIELDFKIKVLVRPKTIHVRRKVIGRNAKSYCVNIEIHNTPSPVYHEYINDVVIKGSDGEPATPKNIIEVLENEYPVFFDLNELRILRAQCEALKKENSELKQQIEFMPGGPGFKKAKEHFEETVAAQMD